MNPIKPRLFSEECSGFFLPAILSMIPAQESRRRGRWQPMRLAALSLLRMGVAGEVIAISGMIFGIVAGVCFLFTSETERPSLFWLLALACCVLRILALRIEGFMRVSSPENLEDDYQQELPERVSDAVTLIGFGFAAQSSPWLGLASALAAIFSAYMRSVGVNRGATQKEAASGPMTRVHRLLLLSLTSILMITGIGTFDFQSPLPVIAMWIIFFGCIATVFIRWLRIQN